MEKKKFIGACHCKKVKFKFLSVDHVNIIECNCSICRPINFLHLIIPHKDFTLINGKRLLKTYKFGTKSAIHFFCTSCGVKSFYQPRSHKNCYSINYLSINNPPLIKKKIKFDGKNYEKDLKNIFNKMT